LNFFFLRGKHFFVDFGLLQAQSWVQETVPRVDRTFIMRAFNKARLAKPVPG
jgi:hypothetical protein